MSVDKFGRHTLNNRGPPGRTGIGFNLDINGNFNISDKRITNLSNPINDGDAVTKIYCDKLKVEIINYMLEVIKNQENDKSNVGERTTQIGS